MISKVDFSDKTALVTGATGAIGGAVSRRLAADGANLVLLSSGEGQLNSLIQELETYDVRVEGIVCDLSSLEGIMDVTKQVGDVHVDILINSAGIFPNSPIEEMEVDDYLQVLNVNLNSAYLLCSALSQAMVKRGWGRIVNIGSSSCYSGFRNTTAYCVSKHGLLGLSRSLHDELKEHGVRVSCISPSSTQGRMGLATVGQDYSTFLDPEEVADYVVFAISHDGNAMLEELFIKRMVIR